MARKSVRSASPSDDSGPAPRMRATHIVLFRSPGEAGARVMSAALDASVAGRASRSGALSMASDGGKVATIYEALGAASATLSPVEAERLRDAPEVEAVFPNEVRRIPTPVPETRPFAEPFAGTTPDVEYLMGLRDGLDLAIGRLGGRRAALAPALRETARSRFVDTSLTWGLQAIGLGPTYPLTGAGVTVAVLDTGFASDHPDFVDREIVRESFIEGETADDGNGHGTHCAGTIGGPATSIGRIRYGVAPGVRLMVGKVLSDAGFGSDDGILDGIQWAIDGGARIISMSLGSDREHHAPFSPLYERLAQRLLEDRPGCLMVAAAGNESRRPTFTRPVGNPAACPSILAVAAFDADLAVAFFSCRTMDGIGGLELSGPGMAVYSAAPRGGFSRISGTSQATPHVAGVAALHFEADSAASASEIWDRLVAQARPLGDHDDFGAGLVQVPSQAQPPLIA